MIREKYEVINAAGVWGEGGGGGGGGRRCDSTLVLGPGQSLAGRPGKFNFYSSKGHRIAYYLFNWGIFVWIGTHEIITICDLLVSWKIFVLETLNS